MRDGVGLVAVIGQEHAARRVGRGLRALRTRGGDTAGVVGLEAGRVRREAGVAWLDDEPALDALGGATALGATLRLGPGPLDRDRAVGLVDPPAVPAVGRVGEQVVAAVLAGALVDAVEGIALETPSEVLLALVQRSSQRTLVNRVVDALWGLRGGFAGVVACEGRLVAVRDAWGLRPLVIGRDEGSWVVASDARAVEACGATLLRAVEPGELVVIEGANLMSVRPLPRRPAAACVMEVLGLGAPGDPFDGREVDALRRRLGAELAAGAVEADQVVAADAASVPAALAWAEATRARYEAVFIEGESAVSRCAGQAVVLLTGGPEGAERARRLLRAGAREVHLRALAPPPSHACPYGVAVEGWDDTPGLSVDRLRAALGRDVRGAGLCDGCLSGVWPVMPETREEQLALFRGRSG
jgi:amidophosphoribosyltransferase